MRADGHVHGGPGAGLQTRQVTSGPQRKSAWVLIKSAVLVGAATS